MSLSTPSADSNVCVPKLVLFVCVSNTCRSPMAEHLFRKKLGDQGFSAEEFVVGSRSLSTDYEPEGSPASYQGVEVMQKVYGIDMTAHRSKLLTEEDVEKAFMIIPVKRDLGNHIRYLFPAADQKLHFLKQNISDPWHQPVSVFEKCAEMIDGLLDDVIRVLPRK